MLSTHFTCWLTFGSWFFRQRERSRPKWAAPEWILAQYKRYSAEAVVLNASNASKDGQSPRLMCLTCCWRKRLTSCFRELPKQTSSEGKNGGCCIKKIKRDNLGFHLQLKRGGSMLGELYEAPSTYNISPYFLIGSSLILRSRLTGWCVFLQAKDRFW